MGAELASSLPSLCHRFLICKIRIRTHRLSTYCPQVCLCEQQLASRPTWTVVRRAWASGKPGPAVRQAAAHVGAISPAFQPLVEWQLEKHRPIAPSGGHLFKSREQSAETGWLSGPAKGVIRGRFPGGPAASGGNAPLEGNTLAPLGWQ